jgi:hypothetical protein
MFSIRGIVVKLHCLHNLGWTTISAHSQVNLHSETFLDIYLWPVGVA